MAKIQIKGRLSYPHLFVPQENDEDPNAKPKYSAVLLVDKKDKKSVETLKNAIESVKNSPATKAIWGSGPKSSMKGLTLKDGDVKAEEDDKPEFAGTYIVNAYSVNKPGVVDKDLQKILDPEEVYPGCYVYMSLGFYPYANKAKGIACGLNNVLKYKDGERLDSRVAAEDDFAGLELPDEEDDVI